MTYRIVLEEMRRMFEAAGLENARRQAEWIIEDVTAVGRAGLIAHPDREVAPEDFERCLSLARRRVKGEPLQYVLGHTDFLGLRIETTPDVLIPRPETEQLVQHVLSQIAGIPAPRILDVGTGSGAIALGLRSARPDARVWACDVSSDALRVAYRNSIRLGLPVSFFQADAVQPSFASAFAGLLDVVVSNPPYIARDEEAALSVEVREHEPHLALFAEGDPLQFYRSIAREAASVLRPEGLVSLEVHEERGDAVGAILAAAGFENVQCEIDFTGRFRFASGWARGRP